MKSSDSTRTGEILSHLAMAVVGVALLFGGCACVHVAYRVATDFDANSTAERGAALPAIVGIALLLLGGLLVVAAVLPVSVLEKFFSPPPATLGEEPRGSSLMRVLGWIFFWW